MGEEPARDNHGRWEPGSTGNPEGGRRKRIVKQCLELALAPNEYRRLRGIIEKHVTMAEAGDLAAAKEVYDRLDGKVPQGIIGGEDDDPAIKAAVNITVNVVKPISTEEG